MGKGIKVTEDVYRLAKALINSGEEPDYIITATGLSMVTIKRIKSSKDYQDYLATRQAYNAKYKSPVVVEENPQHTVTEPALLNCMLETLKELRDIVKILAEELGVNVNRRG